MSSRMPPQVTSILTSGSVLMRKPSRSAESSTESRKLHLLGPSPGPYRDEPPQLQRAWLQVLLLSAEGSLRRLCLRHGLLCTQRESIPGGGTGKASERVEGKSLLLSLCWLETGLSPEKKWS